MKEHDRDRKAAPLPVSDDRGALGTEPRPHVMRAYEAMRRKFAPLFKKLAK